MSILIGLDVGTSGTKGLAVNQNGEILASALYEYPLHSPKPGWAEQYVDDWKHAAFDVLSELTHSPTVRANQVSAIGLTGQMHGSVFLDESNDVLRPPLLWCDQRTARQCTQINEAIGEKRLLEMVSNPALTGFTAPKILWLRDNEPHLYEKVRKVLLPKDYIRLLLTGEYATDVADASGTLLFDVKNRRWHRELMSELDIDAAFMPPAFEGPDVTGQLSEEVAASVGLTGGIPVVAGGGDQAAGAIGCGIVRPGAISAALGTSGVVFAYAERVSTDPLGRVHTFCHAVPDAWHVMGVALSAGGSLRWFRDEFCEIEKALARQTGADPYDYITQAAGRAPLGAEGLLFLPYLTGERTPHKDPDARGAFVGLSLRHTRGHMARAVMEGVTFAMRDGLEIIRQLGIPIEDIRASGGGARSALWRQLQADVYRQSVSTLNVEEGPAYGAALLASVAAGMYGSIEEACDATIRAVDTTNPIPANAEEYDQWFSLYQQTYDALAPGFHKAASLLAE